MKKFCLFALMVICLLPAAANAAAAIDSPVIARFDNYYIDDAVVMLTDDAGVSRILCGGLNGSITNRFDNAPLRGVLDQIAKDNRLVLMVKQDLIVLRPAGKLAATAPITCKMSKVMPLDALQALTAAFDMEVAIRGQLKGEVTEELSGTLKDVLDALASKYGFKWSQSRKVVRVTVAAAK
ncbi:MAG: hypothetical protein P4N59_23560 [Negativicutes bacterium]|nr:hypothetical protein [Negativicutes bacterium]